MNKTEITSLSHEELTGTAPVARTAYASQPEAQPAFASLPAEERLRQITADQQRTADVVRAIEAGEGKAPRMPGDVFSLHRRMDRTLIEYNWMKNNGPVLPDFNFRTKQEAAEDARAIVRAMLVAMEAL